MYIKGMFQNEKELESCMHRMLYTQKHLMYIGNVE